MSRNDTITVDVHLHHQTELAYLVSDDGEEDNAVWVPKSQVTLEGEELTIPVWLAEDKGFI